MEKLVDIALRAISPGINDPNTARESINAIGIVLGEISRCSSEKIIIKDEDSNLRVMMDGINFEEILYFTFYQLRHYGDSDTSIILGNIEALIIAAHKAPQKNKEIIWDFHKYIIGSPMKFKELDRIWIQRRISKLKEICNGGM